MGQKKVVLDTNSVISAFGWGGNSMRVMDLALDNKLSVVTSLEQIDELRRVLDYPRLQLSLDEKEKVLNVFLEIAQLVSPKKRVDVITEDPDDNRILEAAVEGKVDYIISGDKHLLDLKKYCGIHIVTASEFLNKHD